jgi:hypothetical protein
MGITIKKLYGTSSRIIWRLIHSTVPDYICSFILCMRVLTKCQSELITLMFCKMVAGRERDEWFGNCFVYSMYCQE